MWSDDDEDDLNSEIDNFSDLSDTNLSDLDDINEVDLQNFVVDDSEPESHSLALIKRAKRLNREKDERLTHLKKSLEMLEARLNMMEIDGDDDGKEYSTYEEVLGRVSAYLNKTEFMDSKSGSIVERKFLGCDDGDSEDEEEEQEDNTAVTLYTFGMPYFKDNMNHSFRKNDEWIRMDEMGIRFVIYFEPVFCWDKVMASRLERAVFTFLPHNLDPNEYRDSEHLPLIDWFKISDQVFDGLLNPVECETMWKLYLCPLNNKQSWSSDEVDRLLKIIGEMNENNWTEIAKRLNSGRSGYQCFMLYVQRLKAHYLSDCFTYEDDVRLLQIIKKSQIGSYISWSKVAYYFEQFTKRRLFLRYQHLTNARTYTKTLPLKRKLASDLDLIKTIDWNKRATKTHKFCQQRNISSFEVPFSRAEDTHLVNLVRTYGVKSWLMLSRKHFHMRRSADQLRHRFRYILDCHTRKNFVKPNDEYKTMVKKMLREIQAGSRIVIGDFHPIPMPDINFQSAKANSSSSVRRRGRKLGIVIKSEEHIDRRLMKYYSGHFSLAGRRKKLTPEQVFPAIVNCLKFLRVPMLRFVDRPVPELFTNFDIDILEYLKSENERLNRELTPEAEQNEAYVMPLNLSTAIGTRYLINYLHFSDDFTFDPNDFNDLESDREFGLFYEHFETLFECSLAAVVPKGSSAVPPSNFVMSDMLAQMATDLQTGP